MKFTPDMINTVIEIMAQGGSQVQVAASLKISKSTLQKWINDPQNTELHEAVELGKTLYEAYFEGVGKDLMLGKIRDGKDSVWYKFMQHKFNWKDKTEVETKSSVKELSDEEINQQLEYLLNNNKK